MRGILGTVLMGLMLNATPVFAADQDGATTLAPAIAAAATSLAQRTDLTAGINLTKFKTPGRPGLLPALYTGSALLEGYDAYSTLTALNSGASEANPLMRGITKSPAAFVALKAGVTMASIISAERMWKDNHRAAAVMMMVVSNGMMAAVAAHNASVLQRVR